MKNWGVKNLAHSWLGKSIKILKGDVEEGEGVT